MEVHTHTHTERKKFTHYLWEFLMLFLAVFCGFLAENFREHQVEKARGMKYVRSFYNDLKTDTAEFSKIIVVYENKINALSKRDECFDSLSLRKGNYPPCMSVLVRNVLGFPDMVNADQTILQLKNAGGLRLLQQADADSILAYDTDVRAFKTYETTGFQERQYRIRELLWNILNYKSMKLKNPDPAIPYLITTDPEKINQFFVMVNEHAFACKIHMQDLEKINQKAAGLINYFKNKYHFE